MEKDTRFEEALNGIIWEKRWDFFHMLAGIVWELDTDKAFPGGNLMPSDAYTSPPLDKVSWYIMDYELKLKEKDNEN